METKESGSGESIAESSASDQEEEEEIKVPSILESITQEQIDNFQPFYERYFRTKYCTKFSSDTLNLDTKVLIHTNKTYLVFISEKHSIITNKQRIKELKFQVSKKINRLNNSMSGKGKRGAQFLQPNSILCFIITEDGQEYPVYAGVTGKLLEINMKVEKTPNFLIENLNEAFLALILPDLHKHEQNIKSLISREDYNNV